MMAMNVDIEQCRRLTREEVLGVRDSLRAGRSHASIAARLEIPLYVVRQIESGTYFTTVCS